MQWQVDPLLPLGEKGRDEGMSPRDVRLARKPSLHTARRVSESATAQRFTMLNRALTPFPLSPKGRGK